MPIALLEISEEKAYPDSVLRCIGVRTACKVTKMTLSTNETDVVDNRVHESRTDGQPRTLHPHFWCTADGGLNLLCPRLSNCQYRLEVEYEPAKPGAIEFDLSWRDPTAQESGTTVSARLDGGFDQLVRIDTQAYVPKWLQRNVYPKCRWSPNNVLQYRFGTMRIYFDTRFEE